MEIGEFLTACFDEDERIARAASGCTVVGEPGNWKPSPAGDEWEAYAGDVEEELLVALRPGLHRPPDVMSGKWGAWVSNEPDPSDPGGGSALPALTHAARHDPARVLREIDAKRELLALLPDLQQADRCIEGEWGSSDDLAEKVLAALLAPYPKCGATAVFWPEAEGCDAVCVWPRIHDGTRHMDAELGQWDESELTTHRPGE